MSSFLLTFSPVVEALMQVQISPLPDVEQEYELGSPTSQEYPKHWAMEYSGAHLSVFPVEAIPLCSNT